MKLDTLDKFILNALIKDSRAAFTKIADEVTINLKKNNLLKKEEKIPDTTVHFRVKKLKENSIIKRFTIEVDPLKLGYNVISVVKINVGGHIIKKISINRTKKLANILAKNPNITFLAISDDGITIYAILVTKDGKEFKKFLEELQKNPDVDEIQFNLLSDLIKGSGRLVNIV
ncbi:MAG: Lrp/AsnC family transcriptional regulator [Candidatus Odinarchaeia archaeon]